MGRVKEGFLSTAVSLKMEITALSVTEKAEVFKNVSALSSVECQMEEFISYADKSFSTDVK